MPPALAAASAATKPRFLEIVSTCRQVLQVTTLVEVLQERYAGRFTDGQVRTLQRRLRDWRAIQGPEKEERAP